MNNTLWLMAASALCFIGMAWLSLSLKTHWQQVYEQCPQASPLTLRWAGAFALALSAICCLAADHPSMAILVWVMFTAASALSVAMVLSYRPKVLWMIGKPFVR